jgi:hypothetical protein
MVDLHKLADGAVTVTDIIGRVAAVGDKVLPALQLIAPFIPIPYASNIIAALTIAQPWIDKIAAGTPVIEKAIQDGMPVIDALQARLPSLIGDFKQVYAIAANADPLHPATDMTAADVSDEQAVAFATESYKFAGKALFGQRWTDEEYQRAWDRAQGVA